MFDWVVFILISVSIIVNIIFGGDSPVTNNNFDSTYDSYDSNDPNSMFYSIDNLDPSDIAADVYDPDW